MTKLHKPRKSRATKVLEGLGLLVIWLVIYGSILILGMVLAGCDNLYSQQCGIAEGFYITLVALPGGLICLAFSALKAYRSGYKHFLLGAVIGGVIMATPVLFIGA